MSKVFFNYFEGLNTIKLRIDTNKYENTLDLVIKEFKSHYCNARKGKGNCAVWPGLPIAGNLCYDLIIK